MSYQFRVEEGQPGAGEVVEVSFEQMMESEYGFLTLPDGREARRVHNESRKHSTVEKGSSPKIVSDAMGFPASALGQFEADRKANGFHGIEFKPDPHVPEFIQVHCSSQSAKDRYMKHRAMHDRNSRNGSSAMLSEEQMERAKKRIMEKYPSYTAREGDTCTQVSQDTIR